MKKRFVLTIALMLIAATLFAAPVFSGRFRQGYSFAFGEDTTTIGQWKPAEAKIVLKLADENGLWDINFKTVGKELDSNDKFGARATIDLGKVLAASGLNLGEFGVKLSIGNDKNIKALSSFADPSGDAASKFRTNGASMATELAMNYGKIVKFNVAFDPSKSIETGDKATDGEGSLVVSAMGNPIDGVSVSGAYAYNGQQFYFDDGKDNRQEFAKSGIQFAADVNVAKLIKNDKFKLGATGYFDYAFEPKTSILGAAVYGGIDLVDGWFEYYFTKADDADAVNGMKVQANFHVVKGLKLDAYINSQDMKDFGDNFKFGGDAGYAFTNNLSFEGNLEYAKAAKTFTVTPKVIIVY